MLAIYLVVACSAQPRQNEMPDWVNGPSSSYPVSQYLAGRGSGPRLADAETRARADLALILEAQINAEIRDQKRIERSQNTAGDIEQRADTVITRNIITHTDQVIRGIEIADIWQDLDAGDYYVLAVLKRTPAIQMLRGEIRKLDQKTALYIEQSRTARDRLAAISSASNAVNTQAERVPLQQMLQVIDKTGRGIPEQWALANLQTDRDSLIGRISIRPRVQGSDMASLENELAAAIAHAGFNVAQTNDSDYTLVARLELDDLGRLDGWYWLKGSLVLTLNDGAERERGTRRWDIKQSGQDPRLARRRAMDQVAGILDLELRTTIIGFRLASRLSEVAL